MNILKKALILCLALCMVFTSCVSAFAFDGLFEFLDRDKKLNYVAIGDSVTRGSFGENQDVACSIDYVDEAYKARNVKESFSYLLAKELGYDAPDDIRDTSATYWPLAMNAITTSFVLDILGIEDFYNDAEYVHSDTYRVIKRRYETMLYYFGDKLSKTQEGKLLGLTEEYKAGKYGTVQSARSLIENADLITVELGLSDILYRAKEMTIDPVLEANGMALLNNTDLIVETLGDFGKKMLEGYSCWYRNYPRLLEYLAKNTRKDCKVVILGTFNPMFSMTITDDYLIPVGNLMSTITDSMNRRYEKLAEKYGFIYVDISNVETGETCDELSFMSFVAQPDGNYQLALTHPTKEGYAQIANWIIDALADEKDFSLKTTIKLDTGRIKIDDIESVKLDGRNRYFYEKDGKLCVPCLTIFGDRLTVTAKSGGKTQISVYSLDYDNGYKAKRIYTTNDLAAVKQSIGNMLGSLKSSILGND